MRIAFNVRILGDPVFRGWNRYTINLIAQMARLGVRIFIYTDRPLNPAQAAQLPLDKITLRQSPRMNYLAWEQYWLPRQCSLDRIDIFHCPVHFGTPQITRAKCILTIHDVIDEVYYRPQRKPKISQRITAFLSAMARHRADYFLTVSEYSRTDIIGHFKIDPARIASVYLAADERFHQIDPVQRMAVRARYSLPARYLFYIGSLEPRKRMCFVLEAMAQLHSSDLHLVVVGGSAADRSVFLKAAGAFGLSHRVQLLDDLGDRDLPALYAEALGFVYPSEYEGFGLQLCEAMAAGCPVLAARASCLPEIMGSGGDTFSLASPSELVASLHRLETDSSYRQDLQRRGKERSRRFSWKRTAEETLAIYDTILTSDVRSSVSPPKAQLAETVGTTSHHDY